MIVVDRVSLGHRDRSTELVDHVIVISMALLWMSVIVKLVNVIANQELRAVSAMFVWPRDIS